MRYFLEVSYKGTNYSGFQTQKNANTIQSELEKALTVFFKKEIKLTGSSRTDAGVHALQNFFHLEFDDNILSNSLYNINAILPHDIVCKNIIKVHPDAHCRFDAISRVYEYIIYSRKNPFLKDRGYYYPYTLDFVKMNEAAEIIKHYNDFSSFSKSNTQVKNFICKIYESEWVIRNDTFVFHIKANRFLRGMVRAITSTILQIGRGNIQIADFKNIIEEKDSSKTNFSAAPQGLFLISVNYPEKYFEKII